MYKVGESLKCDRSSNEEYVQGGMLHILYLGMDTKNTNATMGLACVLKIET